jgi:hypothetical protein
MITLRSLGLVALGLLLCAAALYGQDRSRYRDYPLGGGLSAVSTIAGVPASDAQTLRSRPAIMQEFQLCGLSSMTGSPVNVLPS